MFYKTKGDLLEICVQFLKAGLESNEVCVWVIAEPLTERQAWVALRDTVPDFEQYLAERRIEILRSQTWHFTDDSPDLQKVARGWDEKLADALDRGHEGMRVAASAPQT
jgi:MEDS: MEthanogen/methylotroph, DcmR Sensory domain